MVINYTIIYEIYLYLKDLYQGKYQYLIRRISIKENINILLEDMKKWSSKSKTSERFYCLTK